MDNTVDSVGEKRTVDAKKMDEVVCLIGIEDSFTDSVDNNWTVDSDDEKEIDDSVLDNWTVDSIDDNLTVNSVDDNRSVDSVDVNWILDSEVDIWTVGSVDDRWTVCFFDDNWTVESIENGIIVCSVIIEEKRVDSVNGTGTVCSDETIVVVGSNNNMDEMVDLIESNDNINVCSTENKDWTVVSKGSCESVDNISDIVSIITIDSVESRRKPVKSVYTDNPDDSDDKGTADSVEKNDDVGLKDMFDAEGEPETVRVIKIDTIDCVFDNEANTVSSVDNDTTDSKTGCEKDDSIKDAAVDAENSTDSLNSLTNDMFVGSVYIADVVDSVYIDELWGQSASVSAQSPEEHSNPPSGQGGSMIVPSIKK